MSKKLTTTANIQLCTTAVDYPRENINCATQACHSSPSRVQSRSSPPPVVSQCWEEAAEEVEFTAHCITAVSRPPVEMRRESSWRKLTAVTWLL